MVKSLILCLAALMPLAATASEAPVSGKGAEALANTDEGDSRYRVRWVVSLDAAGHVTDVKAGTQTLVDVVRVPLENAIRGWRFVPGKIDGQPAPTRTMLTLDIALVPAGDHDPGCGSHTKRKCGDRCHWVPAHAGNEFLQLVRRTPRAASSDPELTPGW